MLGHLHKGGDERHENDAQDHYLKVLVHPGQGAKEVSREDTDGRPEKDPDQVVAGELAIGHFAHARHKGGKGTEDGSELEKNEGLHAVLLIDLMGLIHVLLVHEFPKNVRAEEAADPIVAVVAQ